MKQKIQSINRKSLIRLHQNVKVLVKKDCKEKGRLWTIRTNKQNKKRFVRRKEKGLTTPKGKQ